jgi:hypothetical protein
MRSILSLIALALLMQGCATMSSVRVSPDGDEMKVEYKGPAQGAVSVINADTTGYNAETARVAVESGMPVQISTNEHGTSLSAGYTGYGMYGGGYGMHGYGQVLPDVVTVGPGPTGMVPVGPSMGGLPVLGPSGLIMSPTGGASGEVVIDPNAKCPKDETAPRTLSEEAACQREYDDWQTRQIGDLTARTPSP